MPNDLALSHIWPKNKISYLFFLNYHSYLPDGCISKLKPIVGSGVVLIIELDICDCCGVPNAIVVFVVLPNIDPGPMGLCGGGTPPICCVRLLTLARNSCRTYSEEFIFVLFTPIKHKRWKEKKKRYMFRFKRAFSYLRWCAFEYDERNIERISFT